MRIALQKNRTHLHSVPRCPAQSSLSKHTRSSVTGSGSVRVTRSICHLDNQWFLSDVQSWRWPSCRARTENPILSGENYTKNRFSARYGSTVSLMRRWRHFHRTLAVSLDSMNADEIDSDRLQENIPLTYSLERSRSRWGDGECLSWLWLMAVILIHVCCSHLYCLRGTWWTPTVNIRCARAPRESIMTKRREHSPDWSYTVKKSFSS